MNQPDKTLFDYQTKLIYSMIVAGKSANFADKAMNRFMCEIALYTGCWAKGKQFTALPFEMLAKMQPFVIENALRTTRTGNYGKLTKAIAQLLEAKIDLATCKPEELEKIHGIGPKTSRFLIMWCRPQEKYAALDVHILRWMRQQGYAAPASTPQGSKVYAKLEQAFIAEAEKRGKTPRELDEEIWVAAAGRTQKTALPNQTTTK